MIDRTEFISLAMHDPNYGKALEILRTYGEQFSLFSCSKKVIEQVLTLKDEPLLQLVKDIKEANAKQIDIEIVQYERANLAETTDGLKDFFDQFENVNNKERLWLLIGETGVGKTYAIEGRFATITTYACRKDLDPYSLAYFLADTDGTGLKPHETPFLKAVKNGGHIFLDEMNELPQDTLMFLQGLTDEKSRVVIGDEEITISKNFKILGSMNPPSETDERTPLGDALLGRAVGFVMELTDEILMDRLKVTKPWLNAVRRLFNHVKMSGMTDIRDLNYRDYQKFVKYNFEQQFKFKVCQGDVANIQEFKRIQQTGEYKQLIKDVMICKAT